MPLSELPFSAVDLALPPPAPLSFRYEQYQACVLAQVVGQRMGKARLAQGNRFQLQLPQRVLVAPADYLVWIPAGLPHAAHIRQALDYVSIYVAHDAAASLPAEPCLIAQTPLIRALLDDFCQRGLDTVSERWDVAQSQLLLHRLQQAGSVHDYLPDSDDRLLLPILRGMRAQPGAATTLADWARQVHSTERTLARRFAQLLGMSFVQWRSRLRLLQALGWLKQGRTVSDIAAELGYATPSAFIAMFVKQTGITPDRYRRQLLAEGGGA